MKALDSALKFTLKLFPLLILLLLQACLRDDFSKLSKTQWSPDLAFPIVNSEMSVNDILMQDKSPTLIDADQTGLVRIIYDSDNRSDIAKNLITLPSGASNEVLNISQPTIQTFDLNGTLGFTITDSIIYQFNYPISGEIAAGASIDTIFFKSGIFNFNLNSAITHNTEVRIEIPQLYFQNEPFSQTHMFSSIGIPDQALNINRNLASAYLLPGNNEQIEVKITFTIERTNASALPANGALTAGSSFSSPEFRKLSGFFGSFQMPFITNDTLQLRIFRNAISAQNLSFENVETIISIQNSTGIQANYNLISMSGYRNNISIPNLDLSAYSFPQTILPQSSFLGAANQQDYLFDANNSNLENMINLFPRFITRNETYSLQGNLTQNQFLSDTSSFRIYQKIILPLNGITLDLQLRDTIDFNFDAINRNIEELLLRLNIDNGFPLGGLLQVYFAYQNENISGSNPLIVDSLYTQGNLVVMEAPEIDSNGEAVGSAKQITDAVINSEKWLKLKDSNCNRILINARLTTSDLGTLDVRVLDDNLLTIRIGARIKLSTTF